MKFTDLQEEDKEFIIKRYRETDKEDTLLKDTVQEELSEMFDVSKRTIRTWVRLLGIVNPKEEFTPRALVYDIETSRATAKLWWTGKQFVNYKQIVEEPKIISIAWKWIGEDKVEYLTWDKEHNDEKMLKKFLKVYNSADLIIGQNNDKFDNRWINARAAKFNLDVNVFVKSFDIMKQTKRLFRLLSYSMDAITKFLGVVHKQGHEGMLMWDMIEDGTKEQQKEYLQKMVDYNIGDIVATEAMYLRLRKYMGHKIHYGTLQGKPKYTCPNCGGDHIEEVSHTSTAAGTLQHIMKCKDDGCQFKLNNTQYLKYLDR